MLEKKEIYIEAILYDRHGVYVFFNCRPNEVFSYIPGIKKRTRLKNQNVYVHFPWVYQEAVVLATMRCATLYHPDEWVYIETGRIRTILKYKYVFFSGLKQRHTRAWPVEFSWYRHRRAPQLYDKVVLPLDYGRPAT